jgi:hypothetical protein
MTGVLIFFVVMTVILFLTRIAASRYFDKTNFVISSAKEEFTLASELKEDDNEISEELVAVISSAAFVALNKNLVVKKIQFLSGNDNSAWSRAGRLNIMSSHSVKH